MEYELWLEVYDNSLHYTNLPVYLLPTPLPALLTALPLLRQVTRIVRITVTGNVFFAIRAACELAVGMSLYLYYKRESLPLPPLSSKAPG